MLTASSKLTALRAQMNSHKVQAYLIPRADEYMGEFVAEYAERLRYITGFTGSAGLAIIMEDTAFALSDARYTLQIAGQVEQEFFQTGDYITTPPHQWISKNMEEESTVGYDPHLHTASQISRLQESLQEKKITLKPISENLVDKIWDKQPAIPQGKVSLFSDKIAGQSTQQKIEAIQKSCLHKDGNIILTLPDSIAWLLNIRGNDTEYIPQVLSTAILNLKTGTVQWFVHPAKVPDEVQLYHGDIVENHAPHDLEEVLKSRTGAVYLDFQKAPIWYKSILEQSNTPTLINQKDPCILLKSQKTPAEQEAIRQAHIIDGAALVKFFHWLESAENIGELDAAKKLKDFRRKHPAYKGNSFPTICGFGTNGAIVHYRATEENNAPIGKDNLLLIDSGAQYYCDEFAGTTDITRTIPIGTPSAAMKKHFTLVLKGHIALASAKFPQGTTGAQIDTYARRPLWEHNIDYNHGTGHGVGCYLAVHEESAGISPRGTEALLPGMFLSNEPGYYEENAYGIRIENLVLVKEIGKNTMTNISMLGFETLSYAPIDSAAIDSALLSKEERDWLNEYHKQTLEKLSPYLSAEEVSWLERKTKAI